MLPWWKCFFKKDRIYEFLTGLNGVCANHIRVQVLGKEDFPSLDEAIVIIRGKKGRRVVMDDPQVVESLAMVARNTEVKNFDPN